MCFQVLWQSSIYLESVAILPQLTVIMRTQNIDNLTGNYIALLGAYRAFYILNWIYRYFTEKNYVHVLGAVSRCQMLQICPPVSDFFCLLSFKLSDRSSVRITCSTLLHHSLPCVPARLVTSAHALLCMCSVARGPVANRLVRRLLLLLFQKLASQQQAQAARMK
jgi:ER lumen protein retaining receptor